MVRSAYYWAVVSLLGSTRFVGIARQVHQNRLELATVARRSKVAEEAQDQAKTTQLDSPHAAMADSGADGGRFGLVPVGLRAD
jgi:hypothetical protein